MQVVIEQKGKTSVEQPDTCCADDGSGQATAVVTTMRIERSAPDFLKLMTPCPQANVQLLFYVRAPSEHGAHPIRNCPAESAGGICPKDLFAYQRLGSAGNQTSSSKPA